MSRRTIVMLGAPALALLALFAVWPAGRVTTPVSASEDAVVRPPWPVVFPRAAKGAGSVVEHPKVAFITFQGDELESAIAEFNEKLRAARYFESVGREYGIGPIASVSHVRLDEPAPPRITDSDLRAWLARKLDGTPPFGRPDPDTLYAIYYPAGTKVIYGERRSCSFDGYHGEIDVGGVHVGFAVLPRCPAKPPATVLDKLTTTASHEYFEWASDPFPFTNEAWHKAPPDSVAWAMAFFPELADMCDEKTALARPEDLGFTVQRIWSNASSLAGHDPCQPGGVAPFAAAIPRLPDTVTLPFIGSSSYTVPEKGSAPAVGVRPGTTTAVPVFVYGERALPTSFRLSASSRSSFLTVSANRSDVVVGDEVAVSVTSTSDFVDPAVVILELSDGRVSSRWPFLVAAAIERDR